MIDTASSVLSGQRCAGGGGGGGAHHCDHRLTLTFPDRQAGLDTAANQGEKIHPTHDLTAFYLQVYICRDIIILTKN